jgi:hypothetical protein
MVLYRDDIVELDYAAAQEILYVELQDQRGLCVSEVKKVFMSIVVCAREHRIPKVLLDLTRNAVEMTKAEYKSVFTQLVVGLMPTPIRKVARVATKDPVREHSVDATYREIQKCINLPLEFRSFAGRDEALRWLMA